MGHEVQTRKWRNKYRNKNTRERSQQGGGGKSAIGFNAKKTRGVMGFGTCKTKKVGPTPMTLLLGRKGGGGVGGEVGNTMISGENIPIRSKVTPWNHAGSGWHKIAYTNRG